MDKELRESLQFEIVYTQFRMIQQQCNIADRAADVTEGCIGGNAGIIPWRSALRHLRQLFDQGVLDLVTADETVQCPSVFESILRQEIKIRFDFRGQSRKEGEH